nr:hypothetical protein [Tanacetum cinerariifolium]
STDLKEVHFAIDDPDVEAVACLCSLTDEASFHDSDAMDLRNWSICYSSRSPWLHRTRCWN